MDTRPRIVGMTTSYKLISFILAVCFVTPLTARVVLRFSGDPSERPKRGYMIPGLRAWNAIVKNSRKVGDDGSNYIRKGGYIKALEDFYATRPVNVKFIQGKDEFEKIGTFGERTIVLHGRIEDGVPLHPIVKVYKTDKTGADAMEEVITYMH